MAIMKQIYAEIQEIAEAYTTAYGPHRYVSASFALEAYLAGPSNGCLYQWIPYRDFIDCLDFALCEISGQPKE